MGGEVKYRNQKTLSKVLKLDENNQYGFWMTKRLRTGLLNTKEVVYSERTQFVDWKYQS